MKVKLTNKQKLALWGLIKYPDDNDREVSEKINMKLSTLTTIRYKVVENKYYKKINVPLVNRIGFEIFGFFILRTISSSMGKSIKVRKNDFPNLVYIAHDKNRLIAFGFYPNYSMAQIDLHNLAKKMRNEKCLAKSGHWWKFISLKNDDITNYFDMSSFINSGLDMKKSKEKVKKTPIFEGDTIHLSSFERKVLEELVANPDETDVQISNNLNITRSTVARIRARLLGLAFKTLNIVDLSKINYKAISIAAPSFNTSFISSRINLIKVLNSIEYPIFLSVGDYGAIYMTAHKELKGIRNKTNVIFRSGAFKGYTDDPAHLATLNLNHLKVIRNHEYLPLVKQALNMYEYKPKRRKRYKK